MGAACRRKACDADRLRCTRAQKRQLTPASGTTFNQLFCWMPIVNLPLGACVTVTSRQQSLARSNALRTSKNNSSAPTGTGTVYCVRSSTDTNWPKRCELRGPKVAVSLPSTLLTINGVYGQPLCQVNAAEYCQRALSQAKPAVNA